MYKNHTIEELRNLFKYVDGKLYWKPPHRKAGNEAGSPIESNGGYRYIGRGKGGKQYQLLAHRVVWAVIKGEYVPDGMVIDHINGNPDDNRVENLRIVTQLENARNRGKRKKKVNSRYVLTSVPGVKFDKQEMCYVVTAGSEELCRTLDFDDAKYTRWDWEFDNNYTDRV